MLESRSKLAVGISHFDSARELNTIIPSIIHKVDELILVNGRYPNFPIDHDYSQDNTDDILKKYDLTDNKFSGEEYQKRQKILDIAADLKCEFVMMWDTDEFIHPGYKDWNKFKKNLSKFSNTKRFENMKMYEKYGNEYNFNMFMFASKSWDAASNHLRKHSFHKQPRIFKNPQDIRYALQSHYKFTFKCISDDMIVSNPNIPLCLGATYTVDGIRLTMSSVFRKPEQLEARELWSHDNYHEERARLYYMYCKAKGHPENIPPNEPHYFDENGYRKVGKRPIIVY